MTLTLLDAIDELTAPQHLVHRQDAMKDGKLVPTKVRINLPCLLEQMVDAIRSSMGGNTAGAGLAHERSILDNEALFDMMKIASTIRDWCIAARLKPGVDPAANLRAWYVATLSHPLSEESERFHVRQLGQWAGRIRAKLDPWREKDLPDECPFCGATEWWRDGQKYFRPLIVRYKPSGPDMVQQAKAMCRSCGDAWNVRELAYAIERAAEAKAATA